MESVKGEVVEKRGGARPGSGRKPLLAGLLTRGRIIGQLDAVAPEIIERLITLSRSENEGVSLRACLALFSKIIPESLQAEKNYFGGTHFSMTEREERWYSEERDELEKEVGKIF